MQRFMLLTCGKASDWRELSPGESQRIMEESIAFHDALRQGRWFASGSAFAGGGYEIKASACGITASGPYSESQEAPSGYLILRAENMGQALDLARGCPGLKRGDTIQVFELVHD